MYQVKRHSNQRHPIFDLTTFINPHSPLTDMVIVHIGYMNETTLGIRLATWRRCVGMGRGMGQELVSFI